jgi:hypothetical protein
MLRVTFIVRVALLLVLIIWAGFVFAYPGDNKPIRLLCTGQDKPETALVLWTDNHFIVGDRSYTIDVNQTTDRAIITRDTRGPRLYIGQDRIVLSFKGRDSVCRVPER